MQKKLVISSLILVSLLISPVQAAQSTGKNKSLLSFNSSGDSSGGLNYKVDVDHVLPDDNHFLATLTHSVVTTVTQKYSGNAVLIGFGTNSSEEWSHRASYEYAALGDNLDVQSLSWAMTWARSDWSVKLTPEAGRIGLFAGMPVTRVDIDRLGAKLDVEYFTNGPWRFLFSAATNNFYGDESQIPAFLVILRYTSAGLFVANFYKSRLGLETGYSLPGGSVAFGVDQTATGGITTNSVYLSADSDLSDRLLLRAEFGQSFSSFSGWYATVGFGYRY